MPEFLSDRELTPRQHRSVLAGFMGRVLRADEFAGQANETTAFREPSFWRRHPNRKTVPLQIMRVMAHNWIYDVPMLDSHGDLAMHRKQLRAVQDPFIQAPQYEFTKLVRQEEEEAQYLGAELILAELDISLQQKDIDLEIAVQIASACDATAELRNPVEKIVHDVYNAHPSIKDAATGQKVPFYEAPLTSKGDAYERFNAFKRDLRIIHTMLGD